MIVLDTNVVSELGRQSPDPNVLEWIEQRAPGSLYITATVAGELCFGVERLPAGRRRSELEAWLLQVLDVEFPDRTLPLCAVAGKLTGRMMALAEARGHRSGLADTQIAAVAARHGMTVATRDIEHFEPFGIPLINPWTDD